MAILPLLSASPRIEAVREIDETINRRKGSEDSHTFHGRDVYSYTGARLASGVITYEEVGPLLAPEVLSIDVPLPDMKGNVISGFVPYLHSRPIGSAENRVKKCGRRRIPTKESAV